METVILPRTDEWINKTIEEYYNRSEIDKIREELEYQTERANKYKESYEWVTEIMEEITMKMIKNKK
jgi:hypothetical protein